MGKYYIDSNVLISLLREEMNGNFRLLFIEADAFLKYIKEYSATLVVSELLFYEVEKNIHLKKEDVLEYFTATLNIKIEQASMKKQDLRKAKKFEAMGIHSPDSKHLAIAIRTKCNYIVTFNKKDFEKAIHIIKIREPREFM